VVRVPRSHPSRGYTNELEDFLVPTARDKSSVTGSPILHGFGFDGGNCLNEIWPPSISSTHETAEESSRTFKIENPGFAKMFF
jgi:hypothetical protein